MHAKTSRRNHLYRLRRIRGLQPKHVAALLGYRGASMVSRFETGRAHPSLVPLLALEIVLGANASEMYVDLRASLQEQIINRARRLPARIERELRGRLLGEDPTHERDTRQS